MSFPILSFSDVVTLNDNSKLICEILSDNAVEEDGIEYYQIRVNNSLVWIQASTVTNIEKKPLPETSSPNQDVEALLKRLTDEGKIVSTLNKADAQTSNQAAQTSGSFELRAKHIRGWAYSYPDALHMERNDREPLKQDALVPVERQIVVSPNSRITLSLGKVGEMGLEPQCQIRFDEARIDRTTYRIGIRLIEGACWLRINTAAASWRNLIFQVNAVRTVMKEEVLYLEAGERTGAVDITFLEGSGKLNFWRSSGDPYPLALGERASITPNSNYPDVAMYPEIDRLRNHVQTWDDWKPEELPIPFDVILPPLVRYPGYDTIPALHPYNISIDETMILPPQTRSLGEILKEYRTGLENYKKDIGRYPSNTIGLKALEKPFGSAAWKGPYIPLDLPKRDTWGSEFIYETFRSESKTLIDVRSMGPNRKDDKGLEDDIR